jgi:iron complex outermembrane recepter protein
MAHRIRPSRAALGAATVSAALAATAAEPATDTVIVTGRSEAASAIAGFGDVPLAQTPLQIRAVGNQQLADTGIESIGGLTKLDASVGDAYNAEGYWSIIAARGYTLDNRFNYRRDGLPINAETAIALDNKERLELLKGTSGIQAGTSAPGGLVNLVVKRPLAGVRNARLQFRQDGSLLGAVDLGDRAGADGAIGWRVNAAFENLDPPEHNTQGQRWLLALAGDWQPRPDMQLEAEIESSHQSQPSVVGFSMLGNQVPAASSIDPRINLNHQPWGQPVVLDGDTASLRWQQQISDDWRLRAHAMTQRLKSDDRTAFPYGVYESDYTCPQWCDRFAPDGTFTYWQYISDNERRTSDAAELALAGRASGLGIEHLLETGVLWTRYRARFQEQVFDIAGTGRIDGSLDTPPSAGTTSPNTNRDDRSTEFYLRDMLRLGAASSVWVGLRHTSLARSGELTSPVDGSLSPTSYSQGVTTPWLAVAQQLTPRTMIYASWGQGLESDAAPNRPLYTNAGQPLPALKSRQIEVGTKHAGEAVDAALTLFDIDRPQAADLGSCDADGTCTYAIDGGSRHRGLEVLLGLRDGPWNWQMSVMLLDAKRHGSSQAGVDGTRPVNVPNATLRLSAAYRVASLPGLELQGALVAEGDRTVLPNDADVRIPGWSRLDLGARWVQRLDGTTLTWRVGVDNVADRRAWKESPYQFGHVYLYPLAPRTWRASADAAF